MPPVAARSRDGINNTGGNTLENYKSLLKPDRCRHTDHHQRVSLFTSAIPRTTQPTIQNHLRRHLPSSTSTTLYSTLLYEPNSTHPTLLNPTHHPVSVPSQAIPHAIRSRDQCQDNGRRPHRSVGSTPRISPPEGWRMNPGHRSTLK